MPASPGTALDRARFVSLTTFRRSGEAVSAPVWIGQDGDALIVLTPAETGKVKRLRNDPRVQLRPCSRTGRVAGGAACVAGTAEILDDEESRERLTAVIRRKYGLEYRVVMAVERLVKHGAATRVILRITPS
ncbi:MAG TPA: PPOX class F420-dependent oxidoreductase [Trebonia sp.]